MGLNKQQRSANSKLRPKTCPSPDTPSVPILAAGTQQLGINSWISMGDPWWSQRASRGYVLQGGSSFPLLQETHPRGEDAKIRVLRVTR